MGIPEFQIAQARDSGGASKQVNKNHKEGAGLPKRINSYQMKGNFVSEASQTARARKA